MYMSDTPLHRATHISEVQVADGVLEALFVPWDEVTTIYGDPEHPDP